MTERDHRSRVRALAELRVAHNGTEGRRNDPGGLTFLDPRTASLRGEHEWFTGDVVRVCYHCRKLSGFEAPYCLRDDADALLLVAGACGYYVDMQQDEGEWFAKVDTFVDNVFHSGRGPTPREALSAALYAALIGAEA